MQQAKANLNPVDEGFGMVRALFADGEHFSLTVHMGSEPEAVEARIYELVEKDGADAMPSGEPLHRLGYLRAQENAKGRRIHIDRSVVAALPDVVGKCLAVADAESGDILAFGRIREARQGEGTAAGGERKPANPEQRLAPQNAGERKTPPDPEQRKKAVRSG